MTDELTISDLDRIAGQIATMMGCEMFSSEVYAQYQKNIAAVQTHSILRYC